MSRPPRDSSWHLVAFALVVVGLGILAPLAWWHSRESGATTSLSQNRPQSGGQAHFAPSRFASKRAQNEPVQGGSGVVPKDPALREETAQRVTPINALPTPIQPLPLPVTEIASSLPAELPPLVPQLATLRPPVADQINLDPSILETPALPAAPPATASLPAAAGPGAPDDQPITSEASDELRLSSTIARTTQPQMPDLTDLLSLQKPVERSPLPATPAGPEAPVGKAWPFPSGLVEQLNILAATTPRAAPWAEQVKAEIDRLMAFETLAAPAASESLLRLKSLADEAKTLAPTLDDEQSRSKLLRAGYAIVRRLVIWDQVHTLAARPEVVAAPVVDLDAWTHALSDVDALLHSTGGAANWRKYLLIDRAREAFDSSTCSPAGQRQLARDILYRLHSTQLSSEQEDFLKKPCFAALVPQLEARASETPDLKSLLSAIEQFEHDDRSAHARALAAQFELLRWSPEEEVRELSETLNSYYRNANVRIALTVELINRLVPQQAPQVQPVSETIVGAWVSGQSQTNTRLKISLIPDAHCWQVGLEALGEVASNTSSSKGPATFFQDGMSMFRARKRITVDRRGVHLFSAQAEANANSMLNNFDTNFDGIPFLGDIVRTIARNQYDENQPAAKMETESKIIGQATSRLDQQVAKAIENGKEKFQAKLIAPLAQLNLEPTPVDLETTADRLIARYRVAAREQISAHTPRPQAPGDSMLSVQLHESFLNNVLEKLHLDGRRVELHELYKEMANRFVDRKVEIPEDLPEDIYVTFADEDAVRVDCQDGRVRLTIRLKELAQGTKKSWTNFTVRGYYAPNADQLDANLIREGVIELISDKGNIGIGDQIALRGIFARVLSRNRKIHVVNKQIAEAKELRDQQVTQFVIHDGWMGVALGPKAPGRQAAMYPRPNIREE